MIPLRDDNPSRLTPIVTRFLIGLNLALFVYELALGPALQGFVFTWGLVPDRLTLALAGQEPLGPTVFTVLSSMFLHGGWAHVIGNMWYLWIFGDNVEDRFGHIGFLIFYLLSGFAAAGLHYLTSPQSVVPTLGASGAIAGVLGAYLVAYPRARVHTLVPLFPFIQIVPLPAVVVLGLWFVLQFLTGAMTLGMNTGGAGVAWWAHVGGFAFGAVVMALAGRRRERSQAWVEE